MKRQIIVVVTIIASFFCTSRAQNSAAIETLALVEGQSVSLQEVRQASGEQLARLEEQAYQLKKQKLDQIIDDRLLAQEARRRGISIESLVESEITSKVAAVAPEEVHTIYELNKGQLQKSEAEMEGQIRSLLRDQKVALRRQEYARSLRDKAKVSVYLDPPPVFRVEVATDGPSRGPTQARVVIVEFEDFQCPFCKMAQATLDAVLSHYQGKVKVVHRDFPLEALHPASMRAHEAARCAEQQGKFWEYRDLLYKNASAVASDELNEYATRVGLDAANFKQCMDSEKSKALVRKDQAEGERLGIQGTPAFFINGRPLSGAQSESEFVRIIDEELQQGAAVALNIH